MGFGESFDDFSNNQAIKFIDLLTQAGLNQVDILEAIIDKVFASEQKATNFVKG
jgi:hypothetical protein